MKSNVKRKKVVFFVGRKDEREKEEGVVYKATYAPSLRTNGRGSMAHFNTLTL
jgi:hypothetical protein